MWDWRKSSTSKTQYAKSIDICRCCSVVFPTAVLPSAAERLLKHWKILDEAAGERNGFSHTLNAVLQVRVPCDIGSRLELGIDVNARSEDDTSTAGVSAFRNVDLCRWLLSRSLSSPDASYRPSLTDRSKPVSTGGRQRARTKPLPIDEELIGRVIRAYRSFANAGLFGSSSRISGTRDDGGGDEDALSLAAGLWSSVLCLPEGLRPASEQQATRALRLSIELGLPAIPLTRSDGVKHGRRNVGGSLMANSSSTSSSSRSGGMEPDNGRQQTDAPSLLTGLLDTRPAEKAKAKGDSGVPSAAVSGRGRTGATRGTLFYRRFSEPIHDSLLRRGGTRDVDGHYRDNYVRACSQATRCLSPLTSSPK